jgi:hypothetical protein
MKAMAPIPPPTPFVKTFSLLNRPCLQAIRQEEARKMGLVIQFEPSEEDMEEMMAHEQLHAA